MDKILTELRLALEDYFCGKFTEQDNAIVAELNDGHTFVIRVEEK